MSNPSWMIFQLVFVAKQQRKRQKLAGILLAYMICVIPVAATNDRTAFVSVGLEAGLPDSVHRHRQQNGIESNPESSDVITASESQKPKTSAPGELGTNDDETRRVRGLFSSAGSKEEASGRLYTVNACDDDKDDEELPAASDKDWVSLFYYPLHEDSSQMLSNGTGCQSVLDRVKKAMMFGASAVIILALNPKIAKELDIGQLFSRPVVLIQENGNITAILEFVMRSLKPHVNITYNSTLTEHQRREYTVWSRCWRPKPGSGLVCRFEGDVSRNDPGHFWNYFSIVMALFMLILILKAKGQPDDDFGENVEQSLRRIALATLAVMQIKRYRLHHQLQSCDDSERDTCAVCLDHFYPKQRIRVLPCLHEYHTKCVDPWLVNQRTCPLCKLNIIDDQWK